jgi:plasmid stabilization system protein ParE
MKLRWSARAVQQLYDIGDFIALDDPTAARRWIDRLRERARKAAAMPAAGRRVPELDREDIREVMLRTYRIVYRVDAGAIVVVAVFEGHFPLRRDALDE